MRKIILAFVVFQIAFQIQGQITPTTIKTELALDNSNITNTDCTSKKGMIISNAALNLFFADKVGSYLSEGGDLSLFKNYATLNSADGKLSINSNIWIKKGTDDRIARMTTIGVKVNAADGFASIFANEAFSNELGLTLKHTWLGRGTTFFDACTQTQSIGVAIPVVIPSEQKKRMDAARALILHQLEIEIDAKAAEFEMAVSNVQVSEVPKQPVATVQSDLRNEFYKSLRTEYLKKFAKMQVEALEKTESYNVIKTNWTSISAYVPLTTKTYSVAATFLTNFNDEQIYPWEITLSHNRIRESRKAGRFFFSLNGSIVQNNTVNTDELEKTSLDDYRNLGGTDTLHLASLKSDEAYVGSYSNFITPQLKGQVVWFPKSWNIGLSFLLEQNFGQYDPLNGRIGIPIRLNDKDGDPTINFEIQVRMSDMSNQIHKDKNLGEKTAIGVSVGLPFSSIIF